MKTIQGPGVFLAQFIEDVEPYCNIDSLAKRFSSLGYKGFQIPTWDIRVFDLETASESDYYCDEYKGRLRDDGIEVIELASYLQGQVIAIHPAYELLFQSFYPNGLNDLERVEWATNELCNTIKASVRLKTKNISVLSGGLAWPYLYPWPQRSQGLIRDAFKELSKRWLPILNQADENGITIGFELHPGSDLHDGDTFLRFLDLTSNHPSVSITYDPSHFLLQRLDYIEFIKHFASRITCFHVKDAEFNPNGRTGAYGSYGSWLDRAGRFRTPGDGQVNFNRIFSVLKELGYKGWAVLEWECCIKSSEQGAVEGAEFINRHISDSEKTVQDDFIIKYVSQQLLEPWE